jgi:hypothetical protein
MNPETTAQREMQEHTEAEKQQKRAEFIRKKEQHERNISRVNIPQLNAYQMCRVKAGLSDSFRGELNPVLEEMMPRTDEHGEWAGFEGTYEQCKHRIREHILLAIGRNLNCRYGERRLNPKLQAAAEQSAETLIGIRQVRRDLKKLKDILHTIAETGREMAEGEKR